MDLKELGALVRTLYANNSAVERICALLDRPDLWSIYKEFLLSYDTVDTFILVEEILDITHACEIWSGYVSSQASVILGRDVSDEFKIFSEEMESVHYSFYDEHKERSVVNGSL